MDHDRNHAPDSGPGAGASMVLMMAIMMGACFGSVLLFSLIPVVGWPVGLTIAALGFGAMLFIHQRLMGHGRH